jgi:hypothetical protein
MRKKIRKQSALMLSTDGTKAQPLLVSDQQAHWLEKLIRQATPHTTSPSYPHMSEANHTFPGTEQDFETFLKSSVWKTIRTDGLVLV